MTVELSRCWDIITAQAMPLPSETILLTEAHKRIPTQDLHAVRAHPHTDIAAMDGYGFAAMPAPSTKRLVGTSAAGVPYMAAVKSDECVRIFTGAEIPQGVTTVAMQEDCSAEGSVVELPEGPKEKFIRKHASDFDIGAFICAAGNPLSSRDLAAGLAAGLHQITVFRPARFAVIATGSELTAPGSETGTINSNLFALRALLQSKRSINVLATTCADNPDTLSDTIRNAASKADMIILSGGVSVGDRDYVLESLHSLTAQIHFHGVMMKPGKPSLYARLGDTHILGLPGNPVSTMVCAELLAKPLLHRLQGYACHTPQFRMVHCKSIQPKGMIRENFLRGLLKRDAHHAEYVQLMGNQDSAALQDLAGANCLVRIPISAPEKAANSPCEILMLGE